MLVKRVIRKWTAYKSAIRNVSSLISRFNSVPPRTAFNLGFKQHQNKGCLFGIPELTDENGFHELKQKVEKEAEQFVNEATSSSRKRKLVQVFDDLSDSLCRVADMADFVRMAHPDATYRQAAEEACMAVSSIVQQMNTNVPLYNSLKSVVQHGDSLSSKPYDDVDRRVAQLFLNDFELCGIHLDEEKRKRFVEITEAIMVMEAEFQKGTYQPSVVSKSALPERLHHVFGLDKQITVSNTSSDHPDEDAREAAYRAYLMPSEHQTKALDYMLKARDHLSKLVGFNSFAERALQGTMTETPENASRFLQVLSDQLQPMTQQDFSKMKFVKEKILGNTATLNPWDVTYLTSLTRQHSVDVSVTEISNYLSLGACMDGLRLLTERLYGITLRHVTPEHGECWHNTVHKIQAERLDGGEVIGYIYCDFFERSDKPPYQDCHFTIQGGRLRDDGTYQEPKVVLMMNFTAPTPSKPSLLTPNQLDNLFHEFGHAMHSMIGRTRYQHVTGTRCSTDFAEVPSILMEYFTTDYRVLKEFACHHETGETMPEHMANQIITSKSLYLASDTQLQVFYSALDQVLHSSHPLGDSTINILSHTQNKYYSLPHVSNTAWHLRFGHLVGYGAKYFAYLMSRAIAASIWQHCFKDDPLNRVSGERYMKEILQHGGGRPPADMVENLIGKKPTIDSLVTSLVDETRKAGKYTD